MLIKEYRVPMPLTVEEYRIAQLFMIQKKSRLESSGSGSGVEIIKNEPYQKGPSGDSGQFTYKIFHIGNRIPIWIRNVLPSSALEAYEESWNAYPYTRTRYSCPLISHFYVEVETKYLDDAGQSENVFNLSPDELRNRAVDVIDFVKDPISSHDYCAEEDPKLFRSEKTGRGPLTDNWVEEFQRNGRPVMTAYKLCKVEFKYWGLQTRAERWIHELALRGTMLRAHRQAWAWQDEWYCLTIEDIRRLENETQEYLTALMSPSDSEVAQKAEQQLGDGFDDEKSMEEKEREDELEEEDERSTASDIFFDCTDKLDSAREHKPTLVRWSSELLVNEDEQEKSPPRTPRASISSLLVLVFHGDLFPKTSADSKITDTNTLRSTLETLICSHYPRLKNRVHVYSVTCGAELGATAQLLNGLCSSLGTFHPSLGPIITADAQAYKEALQTAIVNANRTVHNFLATDQGRHFEANHGEVFVVGDFVGGILMYDALARTAAALHGSGGGDLSAVENRRGQFRSNNNNWHQQQQLNLNAKPMLAGSQPCPTAPILRNTRYDQKEDKESSRSIHSLSAGPIESNKDRSGVFSFDSSKIAPHVESSSDSEKCKSTPPIACRQSSNSSEQSFANSNKRKQSSEMPSQALAFRPSAAFLLGCPLALVLIQRKLTEAEQHLSLACDQLFNLYYALDLCAARLEPVLNPSLALLSAPKVPRYQRFHVLGDSGTHFDNNALETPMIWGNRRVDHELYCPPEMSSLPFLALPSILHASYWESKDVSAFILRQFLRVDEIPCSILTLKNLADQPPLQFQMPLTVWNRRRTRFKVANLAANHRANDLIVVDGNEQIVNARFCYGPMDLVVLSQENVLVYVLPSGGEWCLRGVEMTDKHGRLTINLGKTLPIGIHHLRMIVQGDHTFLSVSLAVVPPGTPAVIFSIDGSLTASVSVTGRDPRLRPGAIDVVRFWQQQGYLIVYVTARPDMQQRLVSAWLATHNFPHGLLFFTPSLSTDPLKQKMQFVKHLADIGLSIQAAYGSAKDIPVYSNAGLEPERIFKVGGHRRRTGCVSLDNSYSTHLHDLHSGRIEIAKLASYTGHQHTHSSASSFSDQSDDFVGLADVLDQHQHRTNTPIQRTLSFGPRTGKYFCSKKISQASSISSNY